MFSIVPTPLKRFRMFGIESSSRGVVPVLTGTNGTILCSLFCRLSVSTYSILWTPFHVGTYGSTSFLKKLHNKLIHRCAKIYGTIPLGKGIFCAFQALTTTNHAVVNKLVGILILILMSKFLTDHADVPWYIKSSPTWWYLDHFPVLDHFHLLLKMVLIDWFIHSFREYLLSIN